MSNLFDIVKKASVIIDDEETFYERTKFSVLASTTSELGELGEEIMIAEGKSYKQPGKDGVIGEAIDTILCLLDLIHITAPDLTEADINAIAEQKCNKWVTKIQEFNDKVPDLQCYEPFCQAKRVGTKWECCKDGSQGPAGRRCAVADGINEPGEIL